MTSELTPLDRVRGKGYNNDRVQERRGSLGVLAQEQTEGRLILPLIRSLGRTLSETMEADTQYDHYI
ncbi:MAG: hypothetical protein ACP5M0_00525 [Desulfomonilaceae bacterium]